MTFFSTEELKKCSIEIQIQYNLYVTSQINKAYLLDIFITETHIQKCPLIKWQMILNVAGRHLSKI